MTSSERYSKGQVDRAGRRVCEWLLGLRKDPVPSDVLDAVEVMDWWRREHAVPLAQVASNLRYYVRKHGAGEARVSQRLKRWDTVIDKLGRYGHMQLSKMEDIGGVRAALPDQPSVDALLADLKRQSRWKLRRIREYIDGREPGPKSDGYRAVHVIVVKGGHFVEIQLRTPLQDRWAQAVELDTEELGQRLKYGGGADDLRKYYLLVAELLSAREGGHTVEDDLVRQIQALEDKVRHYYDQES